MIKDLLPVAPAKRISFHHYVYLFGTIIALLALFGTDPDAGIVQLVFGADVVAKLSAIPAAIWGIFILWLGAKTLFDYLNVREVATKACESPNGAGLVLVARSITHIAIAIVACGLIDLFR